MNKAKINSLIFQWDNKASKKNLFNKDKKQRSLDEYFDLLDEIKPHKHELNSAKIFKTPVYILPEKSTLPHSQ
ncbi:MAG: hypothetical protein AB1630_01075 [bacterium]